MPAASPAANALPTAATTAQVPAAADAAPAPKKQRKVFLSGLLGARVKKEEAAPAVAVVRDELEQYLEDADVPGCDIDILKWWRAREEKWPALAKMVKQYCLRRQHHRQEWSVSSRRLARCMVTSRRRPRTRRSSIRSLQRSTLTDRLTLGTSSSEM